MNWLGDVFSAQQPPKQLKKKATVYASAVSRPPQLQLQQEQLQQEQLQPERVQHRLPPPPTSSSSSSPQHCQQTRNLLVLGKQHAGKSAFINTYRRAITGGENWSSAPVGRATARGTDTYEPYYDQSGSSAARRNVSWVLVDTAGRRFNKPMEQMPDEEELYAKMLQGLEWKADLVDGQSWRLANIVPQNAVHHVIFVVPATDVVTDNGIAHLGSRYGTSLLRVKDLASRFAWWEKHLGNAPFVVVTHIDRVAGWTFGMGQPVERMIRNTLGQIVHSNRVFCITNPDEPSAISPATAQTLKLLHKRITMDIEARDSVVLKGRNAVWHEEQPQQQQQQLQLQHGDDDDDDEEVVEVGGGRPARLEEGCDAVQGGMLSGEDDVHSQLFSMGRQPSAPSPLSALAPSGFPQSQSQPQQPPARRQTAAASKLGGGALLWNV